MKRRYVFSVILFVLVLLLSSCDSRTELEKVQDKVINTLTVLHEGDIDTYIDNVYFAEQLTAERDTLLHIVLRRYLDGVRQKGGLMSVEPLFAELSSDSTAVIKYKLNYNNGNSEPCLRHIRKQDDEWYIEEFVN